MVKEISRGLLRVRGCFTPLCRRGVRGGGSHWPTRSKGGPGEKARMYEPVKVGVRTLRSLGLAQRRNSSFPTTPRGTARPGRQALHPPDPNGRLSTLLTNQVAAPASGTFCVAVRRPQNFLSWSRLYLSTNQSPRGHLVAWPIRVSLALGPRFCQSKRSLGSRLSRTTPPDHCKPLAFAAPRATSQSVKAAPPHALLANRDAILAADSSEAVL